MNNKPQIVERVIGFDTHPDTFTAAFVRGPTPVVAVIEKTFNKVPMAQLEFCGTNFRNLGSIKVVPASDTAVRIQPFRAHRASLSS